MRFADIRPYVILLLVIIIMALQPFVGPWPFFFSFFILCTAGRTPWREYQPVARQLPPHRTTQTQNKRTQTSMPWVGFKPTIPASERAKTVHASNSAATVIGSFANYMMQNVFYSQGCNELIFAVTYVNAWRFLIWRPERKASLETLTRGWKNLYCGP
jgi:hypothetical protein